MLHFAEARVIAILPECHASDETGVLLTKTIGFPGDSDLSINAEATGGEMIVEVLDGYGKPIDGVRKRDCVPFTGDCTDQKVVWKSGRSLADMPSRPIQLRFYLRNADLYSFRFAKATD